MQLPEVKTYLYTAVECEYTQQGFEGGLVGVMICILKKTPDIFPQGPET